MDLVQKFLQEHSAEQPVDSVVVKSAFYGKKLKRPHHEFVLFELGNTQNPSLRNHVVLDRKRLAGSSVLSSVQQSKSTTARDEFRFSCDGNREKLLDKCNLTPYERIETIEFSLSDPLPFYELAIVALATSLQRDYYDLLQANCYWFAGLIWEQVLDMCPDAKHEMLRDGIRGTFGSLFSYTPDELERAEIKDKIQKMLPRIEAMIVGAQKLSVWEILGTDLEDQPYNSSGTNTQDHHGTGNSQTSAPDYKVIRSELYPGFRSNLILLRGLLRNRGTRVPLKSKPSDSVYSCTYEERHRQIFPPGFDVSSSSSSTERSYYMFSPEHLCDALTSGYNPEHHVEDIIVKSASYCKRHIAPKHEFILLEIEDRKSRGLKNSIVLDPNISQAPNRLSVYPVTRASQFFAAKDEFRVSYDGDKWKLLAQCDLQDHKTLETLAFKSEEPLVLYQLATLARALSFSRDKYNIFNANSHCSWFSGLMLIWDCIIRMRPSAHHKVSPGQSRGTYLSLLRQTTNRVELQMIYEYVEKELLDIEKRFAIQKQQWTHSHTAQLQDELKDVRRRVRELEAQFDASPEVFLD
ncbi:hypothetical protein RSOLAG22IIIB_06842 [Rhizoctonia solani]|uniref:Uncharacterized protein n=1 Tax=Rhizoctonia solani TaxID=456999 RepID=A0A0K6GHL7_9AGAM|nr:hypothetical protein RSOLAG22IIIB_06842 [Rhizoctonia solani]